MTSQQLAGLRVTCLIGSLRPGGAERVLVRVADWLAQQGSSVEVVTLAERREGDLDLGGGVCHRPLRSNPAAGSVHRRLLPLRRLRPALMGQQPHVVLSFATEANLLALASLIGTGVPIVVSERVDFRQHASPRSVQRLRDVLYARASAVVVQTGELGGWITEHRASWTACVIPNPVVETPVAPRPAWLPPARQVLLGMGRLEYQKGFDTLIAAFARLASDFPEWDLVIAGEGRERSSLARLVTRCGLSQRVCLPGRVDPPWGLIRSADLFVLSSRYEGFPNVLSEAMAAGVPSIATYCSTGPRDLVRAEVDGVLVPVDDVVALASSLSRLMGDCSLRQRLALSAPSVLERYAPAAVLPRWGEVLAQAARGSR